MRRRDRRSSLACLEDGEQAAVVHADAPRQHFLQLQNLKTGHTETRIRPAIRWDGDVTGMLICRQACTQADGMPAKFLVVGRTPVRADNTRENRIPHRTQVPPYGGVPAEAARPGPASASQRSRRKCGFRSSP